MQVLGPHPVDTTAVVHPVSWLLDAAEARRAPAPHRACVQGARGSPAVRVSEAPGLSGSPAAPVLKRFTP